MKHSALNLQFIQLNKSKEERLLDLSKDVAWTLESVGPFLLLTSPRKTGSDTDPLAMRKPMMRKRRKYRLAFSPKLYRRRAMVVGEEEMLHFVCRLGCVCCVRCG